MSLPLNLRIEASRDVEEAYNYLETQQAGLGLKFLDQLDEVLSRIGAMAELYAVVWRNVRAARLRRFLHVVYYRVLDDRIEVIAVLHGSRDSSAWQARV